MSPKYPNVNVELIGQDGNAFGILGSVSKAMRRAGIPSNEIDAFQSEATTGDYNHLLQTVMKWVSVDSPEEEENDWYGEDDFEYDDEEEW